VATFWMQVLSELRMPGRRSSSPAPGRHNRSVSTDAGAPRRSVTRAHRADRGVGTCHSHFGRRSHRLPSGDVEPDVVHRAYERRALAVSLWRPRADSTDGFACVIAPWPGSRSGRTPRASGDPPGSLAPSLEQQRRHRPVQLGQGSPLGLAEADQKLAALAVDEPDRIGQPGRGGATRLRWSSAGTAWANSCP
jgi:hypothetical protein